MLSRPRREFAWWCFFSFPPQHPTAFCCFWHLNLASVISSELRGRPHCWPQHFIDSEGAGVMTLQAVSRSRTVTLTKAMLKSCPWDSPGYSVLWLTSSASVLTIWIYRTGNIQPVTGCWRACGEKNNNSNNKKQNSVMVVRWNFILFLK